MMLLPTMPMMPCPAKLWSSGAAPACQSSSSAASSSRIGTAALSLRGASPPVTPSAVAARCRQQHRHASSQQRRLIVPMATGPAAEPDAVPSVSITVVPKDGPTTQFECESGDQLRTVLLANQVDIYSAWNKVWQCGGAGQCGTCIVEVREGAELLSGRTKVEDKKLANKPSCWRLACQTIVGDGTNAGALVVATLKA